MEIPEYDTYGLGIVRTSNGSALLFLNFSLFLVHDDDTTPTSEQAL